MKKLTIAVIVFAAVLIAMSAAVWFVPAWRETLLDFFRPRMTWEELRPFAEEEFPNLIVYHWREIDGTGYAVVYYEPTGVETKDDYAAFATWFIINGRACGLDDVVMVDGFEVFGQVLAMAYIWAGGDTLQAWPDTTTTNDGMSEWFAGDPEQAAAYYLPSSYVFVLDESEECFDTVLKLHEYVQANWQ